MMEDEAPMSITRQLHHLSTSTIPFSHVSTTFSLSSCVTKDFLRKMQDFMAKAAVVSTVEEDRRQLTWKALREIFGRFLHSERNKDESLSDGMHIIL